METKGTLAGKRDSLRRRALMIQAIRSFLIRKDYLEVETPCLIPAPAPEEHIEALSCGDLFLHTSPELGMKRLLAAGYPRIFQICKCFRSQERGERHLPEFTMLEWYRAGSDYGELMEECEELLCALAGELGCGPALSYRGKEISLQRPWERVSVAEAFSRYTPVSMAQALEKDCFEEMMAYHIEPHLGMVRPTFLYDYPLHPGALSRAKRAEGTLAERFELYLGGMELANASSELTDAREQGRRFQEAAGARRSLGKVVYPPAEKFLTDLAGMPEAAGIALGLDRLAMIMTDSSVIDQVVAFVPEDM